MQLELGQMSLKSLLDLAQFALPFNTLLWHISSCSEHLVSIESDLLLHPVAGHAMAFETFHHAPGSGSSAGCFSRHGIRERISAVLVCLSSANQHKSPQKTAQKNQKI